MKGRNIILLLLIVCLFVGCEEDETDPQPHEVCNVGGLIMEQINLAGTPHDYELDRFFVLPYPPGSHLLRDYIDIYGMAFIQKAQLVDKNGKLYEQGGIRMELSVIDHDKIVPLIYPSVSKDIWAEEAPGGEPYGFLHYFLTMGFELVIDDDDENLITARYNTVPKGYVMTVVGLGDPAIMGSGYFPNEDYLLPCDYFYFIGTRVHMEFRVPNMPSGGDVIWPIHAVFRRIPGDLPFFDYSDTMGNPQIGVISYCYDALSEAPPDYGLSSTVMLNGPSEIYTQTSPGIISEREEIQPRDMHKADYPLISTSTKKSKSMTQSTGFEIVDRDVYRLGYWEDPNDPNTAGYYFLPLEPNKGLYPVIDNDPNADISEILDNCMPYIYRIVAQSPVPVPYENLQANMELQAIDASGEIVRRMEIPAHLYDKSPDNMELTGISEWWTPVYDPGQEGIYIDGYGVTWYLIYMPEGTRPRLSWQYPYADFNHDGEVGIGDMVKFGSKWLKSLPNVGLEYLIFDDENQNEIVDLHEFAEISGSWGCLYDPNNPCP